MSETEKFQEEQKYFNIKRDISRYFGKRVILGEKDR